MYYVIKGVFDEKNVFVSKPPTFDEWDKLTDGVSFSKNWLDSVVCEYSKEQPEGLILTDHIANLFSLLIISDKVKTILEALDVDALEFLPIKLIDHKGREKENPYWIGNFISLLAAVDRDKSKYRGDPDEEISNITKLILLDEVEKEGPPIFRLKEEPYLILFREDLKREIEKLYLTGFAFTPASKFKSIDIE